MGQECEMLQDCIVAGCHSVEWGPFNLIAATEGGEASEDEAPEAMGQEREMLQDRIGQRLADTQTLLKKELVLWNHGYLSIPQVRAVFTIGYLKAVKYW